MPTYSNGDEVRASRELGGIFDDQVPEGTRGHVIESTMFGEHTKVQWDNGTVTEVANDSIKRAEGGGLFD